jgi:hypothetical protein
VGDRHLRRRASAHVCRSRRRHPSRPRQERCPDRHPEHGARRERDQRGCRGVLQRHDVAVPGVRQGADAEPDRRGGLRLRLEGQAGRRPRPRT